LIKRFRWKKLLKVLMIIFGFIVVIALILYFFFNPFRGGVFNWKVQDVGLERILTKEQAIEDLEFLKEKYEKIHYSAIDGLSDEFLAQYTYEIENLSTAPTMLEVWQAASKVTHTLRDGHAEVYSNIDERRFKIPYSMENGTVFLTIKDEKYKVTAINGVSIDDLKKNAYERLSYENDLYKEYQFLSYLSGRESNLRLLGSPIFENYTVSYEQDGKIESTQFEPTTAASPSNKEFVSYEIDKENNVGILTLDKCIYNDHYKKVLEDFFIKVKENHVTNIAIDLRNNGGGSSQVANEFIRYLDVETIQDFTSYYRLKSFHAKSPFETIHNKRVKDMLYNGNVYVLTSPYTFSSAMNFSVLLQDNGLAKVIGEPSGNKPSSYGEIATFLLPNTKLYFTVSIAYSERPDKELKDEPYQTPDYYIEANKAIEKLHDIIN